MMPSHRIQTVQSPIIPEIAELIRTTPGTISLGQGVAYFTPTPQALTSARNCLARADIHKYGPVDGVLSLKRTIAHKLRHRNGIVVEPAERVIVTAGSNMGFYNALLAIADPGDEIVLAHPYYFNHEMAVTMAGCRPVLVSTDLNYHLQPNRIEAAITERTRAIVTISPNNPTGAVYSETLLREVNALCHDHRLYHISDEAYEDFVYGNSRHFSPGSQSDASRHTISLFSLSKGHGLAGWRIGYMVVPEQLNGAIRKIQDTILICPPMISQHAAIGAMATSDSLRLEAIRSVASMRQQLLTRLAELGSLIDPPQAEGAFYVLLHLHTTLKDIMVVTKLVRNFGVAVIPGSAFGITEGCYLRIAYGALPPATLSEALDRLVCGLTSIAAQQ